MADNEAKLVLTAETARFNAAMDESHRKVESISTGIAGRFREMANNVTAQTQGMQSQVNSHFDRIGGAVGKLNGSFLALGAILAGGALFKNAIEETVTMEKEAVKLGKTLGISASEASVLNVALNDIYQDSGVAEAAIAKLSRTLNTSEASVKKLGVETRDANGHFRNELEILLDVNGKLAEFKEGTDRNVEGTKIFGKGWAEVAPLLALTRDRMEESRQKAQELGLIVGKENVEALSKYRAAMNDAGDVMSAVKKTIGDALMPILTKLADWFSSIGPTAVTIFKGAIGGLAAAFWALKNGVTIVWESVNAVVNNIGASIISLGQAASQAVEGDFRAAGETLKAIPKTVVTHWKDAFREMEKSSAETNKRISELFGKQTESERKSGGRTSEAPEEVAKKGGGAKSQVGQFDAQLAAQRYSFEQQKLAQGSFQEFSKQQEAEFWNNILATHKLSAADRMAVQRKYFEATRDVRKEAFNTEIADLKGQQSALRQDSEQRLRIAQDIAAKMAQRFGAGSPQAKSSAADAAKIEMEMVVATMNKQLEQTKLTQEQRADIISKASQKIVEKYGYENAELEKVEKLGTKMVEEAHKQRIEIEDKRLDHVQAQGLAELATHEAMLNQRRALGEISQATELSSLAAAKEEEYRLEHTILEAKINLYADDEAKYAAYQNKLVLLDQKRASEVIKLDADIAVAKKQQAQQSARDQIDYINSELARLRSNSTKRLDLAEQAGSIATAHFPEGSSERKSAGGTINKERIAAELAELDQIEQKSVETARLRVQIAESAGAQIAEIYSKESAIYEDVQKIIKREQADLAKLEIQEGERRIAEVAAQQAQRIAIERESLNQQVVMGTVTAREKLEIERKLGVEEYENELVLLNAREALYELDIAKREEIKQRILQLENRHLLEVQQLQTQALTQQSKDLEQILNPIAQAFDRTIQGMIQGTLTLRKAVRQIGQSMIGEFINLAVRMAVNWIKNQLLMTQATVAGVAIRSAAEKTSSAQSIAISAWTAIKTIGMKAWEAAANVYSSIAAIPYVGPFLAPAMAVAAGAAVIGFAGRIASAEGGYDIPAGVNPVVQTHAREMILPAPYADVIRDLARGGEGSGGSTSVNVQYNVSAFDARGVRDMLMAHGKVIGEVIKTEIRQFRAV